MLCNLSWRREVPSGFIIESWTCKVGNSRDAALHCAYPLPCQCLEWLRARNLGVCHFPGGLPDDKNQSIPFLNSSKAFSIGSVLIELWIKVGWLQLALETAPVPTWSHKISFPALPIFTSSLKQVAGHWHGSIKIRKKLNPYPQLSPFQPSFTFFITINGYVSGYKSRALS